MPSPIVWPERKRFAFTIFDDTDLETVANGPGVYAFLTGLGMRVTKSVWVSPPTNAARYGGSSCAEPDYLAWVLELQRAGHEIALHNVASSTSTREETLAGLDRFRELFGHDPRTLANHVGNLEAIYHGENRVSGTRRAIYNVLTLGRRRRLFEGHVPESPLFWGDACADRVSYVRNFVYRGVDTLAACPYMPYRDSGQALRRRLVRILGGGESRVLRADARRRPARSAGGRRRALHHVHAPRCGLLA